MNAVETLEFEVCQTRGFAMKLTLEIKQQIIEQREARSEFGEVKVNPLYDQIRQTIVDAQKAARAARFTRKQNLTEEEMEDFGMGCQTPDGFVRFL